MAKDKIEKLDKQQRDDHDILVTFVETVKNNHTTLLDKIDGIRTDVKELTDGTNTRLTTLEARVEVIEMLHESIQPKLAIAKLESLSQWIHDFRLTWKFTIGLAGTAGGVVAFLVDLGLRVLGILK